MVANWGYVVFDGDVVHLARIFMTPWPHLSLYQRRAQVSCSRPHRHHHRPALAGHMVLQQYRHMSRETHSHYQIKQDFFHQKLHGTYAKDATNPWRCPCGAEGVWTAASRRGALEKSRASKILKGISFCKGSSISSSRWF